MEDEHPFLGLHTWAGAVFQRATVALYRPIIVCWMIGHYFFVLIFIPNDFALIFNRDNVYVV